jgi:hypothetical protein
METFVFMFWLNDFFCLSYILWHTLPIMVVIEYLYEGMITLSYYHHAIMAFPLRDICPCIIKYSTDNYEVRLECPLL